MNDDISQKNAMKHLFYALLCSATLSFVLLISPSQAVDIYTNAADIAAAITDVPVRMPTNIPSERSFYLDVIPTWQTEGYSIGIYADNPTCQVECGIGDIQGEPLANLDSTITALHPTAEVISLDNGQSAFYVPPEPNFEFASSRVIWEEGAYRYEMRLYYGSKEDVITMANSALANGVY